MVQFSLILFLFFPVFVFWGCLWSHRFWTLLLVIFLVFSSFWLSYPTRPFKLSRFLFEWLLFSGFLLFATFSAIAIQPPPPGSDHQIWIDPYLILVPVVGVYMSSLIIQWQSFFLEDQYLGENWDSARWEDMEGAPQIRPGFYSQLAHQSQIEEKRGWEFTDWWIERSSAADEQDWLYLGCVAGLPYYRERPFAADWFGGCPRPPPSLGTTRWDGFSRRLNPWLVALEGERLMGRRPLRYCPRSADFLELILPVYCPPDEGHLFRLSLLIPWGHAYSPLAPPPPPPAPLPPLPDDKELELFRSSFLARQVRLDSLSRSQLAAEMTVERHRLEHEPLFRDWAKGHFQWLRSLEGEFPKNRAHQRPDVSWEYNPYRSTAATAIHEEIRYNEQRRELWHLSHREKSMVFKRIRLEGWTRRARAQRLADRLSFYV